jgi:hypothetical protein
LKIECYFKENGEKIPVFRLMLDPYGHIIAVEDFDGEIYNKEIIEITITW